MSLEAALDRNTAAVNALLTRLSKWQAPSPAGNPDPVSEAASEDFSQPPSPPQDCPTRYFVDEGSGQYFTLRPGETVPEGATQVTETEFNAPRTLTYESDVKPALKALSEKPNGRALLLDLLKKLGVATAKDIPADKYAEALRLAAE